MAKTLITEHQLDSNLKPLKSGEELSSLELSSQGNGARVTGDLDITGGFGKGDTPTAGNHFATKKYVDDNAGGTVSSEFSYIVSSGFNYSYTGGTKIYLPLNGYIFESSANSSRNEYQAIVMPHNGYLSKVIMRSEEACGESTVGFHKSSTGTEAPNSTAAASVTVDMTADDTATKFAFTSNNTFSAGDIINVSFAPENDANDTVFTCEFILDSSSGL